MATLTPEQIQLLVDTTLTNLTKKLLTPANLRRDELLTSLELALSEQTADITHDDLEASINGTIAEGVKNASAIIKDCIEEAYNQCPSEKDRQAFYKKFSIVVHPDQMPNKEKTKELYRYLKHLNLENSVFQKLGENKTYTKDAKQFSAPLFSFRRTINSPLEEYKAWQGFLTAIAVQATAQFSRYAQPFKFFAYAVHIIGGLVKLPFRLLSLVPIQYFVPEIRNIERSLFDFVFAGDFSVAEKNYLQNPAVIAAARRDVFAQNRALLIGLGFNTKDLESEEDILSTIIKQAIATSVMNATFVSEDECSKKVLYDIKTSIHSTVKATFYGRDKLQALLDASKLNSPLPKGSFGKLIAELLERLFLRLLVTIPLAMLAVGVDVLRHLSSLCLLGVIIACEISDLLTLELLILPLRILDTAVYLYQTIVDTFSATFSSKKGNDNSSRKQEKTPHSTESSYKKMSSDLPSEEEEIFATPPSSSPSSAPTSATRKGSSPFTLFSTGASKHTTEAESEHITGSSPTL